VAPRQISRQLLEINFGDPRLRVDGRNCGKLVSQSMTLFVAELDQGSDALHTAPGELAGIGNQDNFPVISAAWPD
jgi:hypothetical protein